MGGIVGGVRLRGNRPCILEEAIDQPIELGDFGREFFGQIAGFAQILPKMIEFVAVSLCSGARFVASNKLPIALPDDRTGILMREPGEICLSPHRT